MEPKIRIITSPPKGYLWLDKKLKNCIATNRFSQSNKKIKIIEDNLEYAIRGFSKQFFYGPASFLTEYDVQAYIYHEYLNTISNRKNSSASFLDSEGHKKLVENPRMLPIHLNFQPGNQKDNQKWGFRPDILVVDIAKFPIALSKTNRVTTFCCDYPEELCGVSVEIKLVRFSGVPLRDYMKKWISSTTKLHSNLKSDFAKLKKSKIRNKYLIIVDAFNSLTNGSEEKCADLSFAFQRARHEGNEHRIRIFYISSALISK